MATYQAIISPIGQTSVARLEDQVIGHYLAYGYADASHVSGQAVNVHLEENGRVLGDHVVEQIVDSGQQRDAKVAQREELEHLQLAPERFQHLAAQAHGDHVDGHLPPVQLDEAEREGGPYPELAIGQDVTGSDAEQQDGRLREGEQVAERGHHADERYDRRGVVQQGIELLPDVRPVSGQLS